MNGFQFEIELIQRNFEIEGAIYEVPKLHTTTHPFLNQAELYEAVMNSLEGNLTPKLFVTEDRDSFIFMLLNETDFLLLGPFLQPTLPKAPLTTDYTNGWPPPSIPSNIDVFERKLPIFSQGKIISLCELTYYLLHKEKKSFSYEDIFEKKEQQSSLEGDGDLRIRRMNSTFYMNYMAEAKIWDCIQKGDKEQLNRHLESLFLQGMNVLSPNSNIRNAKNLAIITVTLATRAAIDGGLHPGIAYTMSDTFIYKIEKRTVLEEIHQLGKQYLNDICLQVKKYKLKAYSNYVRKCQAYIFNNIYEKLSIKRLATHINLNPVYLSQLFKSETGVTLGKYIQSEKIEEAKRLLLFSDYTIASICALLHFNDQSHFSALFKKEIGQTPTAFRKQAQLK